MDFIPWAMENPWQVSSKKRHTQTVLWKDHSGGREEDEPARRDWGRGDPEEHLSPREKVKVSGKERGRAG